MSRLSVLFMCFLCAFCVPFMCFYVLLCALYGLLGAIALQFVIIHVYLYPIITLIVCALYEHFSRYE